MKHLLLIIAIPFIALASNACNSGQDQALESAAESDSLTVATEETAQAVDFWQKYNFAERQGKRMYDRYCTVCHGVSGEGDGFNAYNLDPRPHSFADSAYVVALTNATLAEIIARGGRGVNKSVLMPAYQATLTEDQIQYVVGYIRTFVKKSGSY